MKENNSQNKPVPSSEYTHEYYRNACQGYSEFNTSKGRNLPARLDIPLKLANLQPGMLVIDVGCGRGEIIAQAGLRGAWAWGGDYSIEAVKNSQRNNSLHSIRRYSISYYGYAI